jgi:hypothetical protein
VLELIAAGDIDAAAGFYDGRAPSVREYCVELCSSDRVDEATLAAFVDLLGRAANSPPEADADEILRRAARTAAAGRFEVAEPRPDVCGASPELLAARINGELTQSVDALEQHLKECTACRGIAARLTEADPALSGAGGEAPPGRIRVAWLELVGRGAVSDERGAREGVAVAGENGARPERAMAPDEEHRAGPEPVAAAPLAQESPPQPPSDSAPAAPPPQVLSEDMSAAPADEVAQAPESGPAPGTPPADQSEQAGVRMRTRRGGLVGAARRLASSPRRHQ